MVNGFDQLDIQLADGSDVTASVVGVDPGDDLAILKMCPPFRQSPMYNLMASGICCMRQLRSDRVTFRPSCESLNLKSIV